MGPLEDCITVHTAHNGFGYEAIKGFGLLCQRHGQTYEHTSHIFMNHNIYSGMNDGLDTKTLAKYLANSHGS